MIRVSELRAGYPTGFRRVWRDVILGVSFEVPRGSITGYLGVNGSGKTTTIKVLAGINPPAAGSVHIGEAPVGSAAAQRQIGYFPEAPFFYDSLSARELLDFFGRLGGLEREDRARRGAALLDEVGLGDAQDVPVRGFSKGMRQRLGLAQALVHEPELLLLDEPLDGLDPMGRLHLRELIARQRERGRTVFFSSHVLNDVELVSDRLVILDGGRIAFDGKTEDVAGKGEGEVAIEVTGDESARAAVLSAAGQAASSGPALPVLELRVRGPEAVDRVIDAARAAGAHVVSVQPRRPSLEEAFLSRFGRSAHAQAHSEPRQAPAGTGAA